MTRTGGANWWWQGDTRPPILRAPPFPGSSNPSLAIPKNPDQSSVASGEAATIIEIMSRLRVGGTFWAKQPQLPETPFILARPSNADQTNQMLEETGKSGHLTLFWFPNEITARFIPPQAIPPLIGDCDPWHVLAQVQQIWADAEDEITLLAAMAKRRVRIFGEGRFANLTTTRSQQLLDVTRQELLDTCRYVEPFHHQATDAADIIKLLAYWRDLIDANRSIQAVFGIAFWKRESVAPLLWGGETPVPFESATPDALESSKKAIAVWKARVPAEFLDEAEKRTGPLLEIEDGFIRSTGLGADCVPPLSIVVDDRNAHYDPSGPSGLEQLLVEANFSPEWLARAKALRQLILATGISKYTVSRSAAERRGGSLKHVLVTGQVEDDRSVLMGGGEIRSNLDLLQRVRTLEPESYIIYRPHPDVDAGHRKGHIPDAQALTIANEIARGTSITALIDMADHVHVLTSLAGFEALLREKAVTTHGAPFYAGWGLTTDLGPVPARRNAKRSLDELVAATLLLYPRYLDPLTGLPCPPEVLIERLAAGVKKENSVIVLLRRLQGTLMRTMKGY